jgi:2,3-bisphosphoglycerate-independent phosphoglycerate mutase
MSAAAVTEALVDAIESRRYQLLVCNYANGDMVGHTGSLSAAIKACETVDSCVGEILKATLAKGGSLIVTADHGNAEQMWDPVLPGPHTAHTLNLVEVFVVGEGFSKATVMRTGGRLADIAPTLLHLMGLAKPVEMTGHSLIVD